MQSLCVWLFPFFAGLCHAELTRELSREAERLGLSSALGLSWNMALQVSALALLLALPPLLSAQGAGLPSSSRPKTPEKCPRPQWDPRLRFVPDRPFYGQNEQTTLSCPGGSQPSPSVIRCVRQGQTWMTPRIIPGALEISPATIKLHWTCEPPESCHSSWKIRAQCWLVGPLSGPCRRPQHTTSEQPLQGLEGTVTCSSLHPFTSYRVTISGGYPATVLYSQQVHTSETAPDQPKIEPLDPSTKTFRWKQLPPCKGAIVGYQLNITARREYNSSFLEVEKVRVNQSVAKYLLHPWRHGTNYTVTIQGLTAAGLGQESRWDFETNISDTCRREGAWTTNVTFPAEPTAFPVNGTVEVTCTEKPESGPFPAKCTELKDRGAVWDISGVQCLRMCNDWVRQVDFDPAQTEFGVGAEGRVTCRQQFQQNSFNVTCRETASGLFEWELGAHKCLREAQAPQRGGRAVAVAVPVVLVLLAAGALLLWFLLSRKRQASASCPAKDTGEALYTELQPRDTPDVYCTIQTPARGAAGRTSTASGWHAAPRAPPAGSPAVGGWGTGADYDSAGPTKCPKSQNTPRCPTRGRDMAQRHAARSPPFGLRERGQGRARGGGEALYLPEQL
ncbi:unnamed protein product [Lepidochelys olivacea]